MSMLKNNIQLYENLKPSPLQQFIMITHISMTAKDFSSLQVTISKLPLKSEFKLFLQQKDLYI